MSHATLCHSTTWKDFIFILRYGDMGKVSKVEVEGIIWGWINSRDLFQIPNSAPGRFSLVITHPHPIPNQLNMPLRHVTSLSLSSLRTWHTFSAVLLLDCLIVWSSCFCVQIDGFSCVRGTLAFLFLFRPSIPCSYARVGQNKQPHIKSIINE